MINKRITAVLIAAALPLFWPLYIHRQGNVTIPFKCLFTTEYTGLSAGKKSAIRLIQDLRIYPKGQDYFLLNGTATYDNTTYRVARTLLLRNEKEIQGKTFRLTVERTIKLPGDNVPAPVMDSILQEYYLTPDSLQIDIFPVRGKTYLIGGPYAFINVCLRY
ncbi:hypothetical protein [Pantoea agglomerans]|uniref:hypothetical protein n=1 Tax=Enterobacter agglomerans TaxID=549 RepID=UPI002413838D|nr:hypothetical protein [Pantoea agglomerans]